MQRRLSWVCLNEPVHENFGVLRRGTANRWPKSNAGGPDHNGDTKKWMTEAVKKYQWKDWGDPVQFLELKSTVWTEGMIWRSSARRKKARHKKGVVPGVDAGMSGTHMVAIVLYLMQTMWWGCTERDGMAQNNKPKQKTYWIEESERTRLAQRKEELAQSLCMNNNNGMYWWLQRVWKEPNVPSGWDMSGYSRTNEFYYSTLGPWLVFEPRALQQMEVSYRAVPGTCWWSVYIALPPRQWPLSFVIPKL